MMSPFSAWYDVELTVYDLDKETMLGKIVGDVRLIANPLEDVTCVYKLFCDKNDLIKNKRYIEFGDEAYLIAGVETWSMGMVAKLKICE